MICSTRLKLEHRQPGVSVDFKVLAHQGDSRGWRPVFGRVNLKVDLDPDDFDRNCKRDLRFPLPC